MTDHANAPGLPPLPSPAVDWRKPMALEDGGHVTPAKYYTPEQMREYGQQCLATQPPGVPLARLEALAAKWREQATRFDEKGRLVGDALIAQGIRKCMRELDAITKEQRSNGP